MRSVPSASCFAEATIAAAIVQITSSSGGAVACDATGGQTWAMSAPLRDPGTTHWCVDYTGQALEKNAALGTNTDCGY